MSRDFQQTHEKLLACAKKHFLEFGFERASIREICKDANVTNGAFYNHFADKEALFGSLVESVVQTIQKIYSESIDKHFDLVKTDELKNLWRLSESTIILLLMYSSGTKYAGFLDDLVRADVQETIKLIAELKARGVPVNDLDEDEWHMLVHSYYASIAEIVMHNYPKPAALKYAHTLSVFFSSGWQTVLGI